MKFDFSANFLRVVPPDTSFSEAWESLCFRLLSLKYGIDGINRLKPPDRGIDIWHRKKREAYQCKSNSQGAIGSIDAGESIKSIQTAYSHRNTFDWDKYYLATNANYTGAAFERILEKAKTLGLDKEQVEHLGPEFWNQLCEEYESHISDRFDYRLSATTDQVVEAFRKAHYYDKYVKEYEDKIKEASGFTLVVTNNRTPVEIEIPFSPELSVKNYLDVAKTLLGISLDWTNFTDLNTSAGPLLSVAIDGKAQPFSKRIGELPVQPGNKLELWVTIRWRDKLEEHGEDIVSLKKTNLAFYCLRSVMSEHKRPDSEVSRRQLTVSRAEEIVQGMMWQGVAALAQEPKHEQ